MLLTSTRPGMGRRAGFRLGLVRERIGNENQCPEHLKRDLSAERLGFRRGYRHAAQSRSRRREPIAPGGATLVRNRKRRIVRQRTRDQAGRAQIAAWDRQFFDAIDPPVRVAPRMRRRRKSRARNRNPFTSRIVAPCLSMSRVRFQKRSRPPPASPSRHQEPQRVAKVDRGTAEARDDSGAFADRAGANAPPTHRVLIFPRRVRPNSRA